MKECHRKAHHFQLISLTNLTRFDSIFSLLNNRSYEQIWIDSNSKLLHRCSQFNSVENQCWTILYNQINKQFCLSQNNCQEKHWVICENRSKKTFVLILIISVLILLLLLFILLIYYCKHRRRQNIREQSIKNVFLSLQNLSLLE